LVVALIKSIEQQIEVDHGAFMLADVDGGVGAPPNSPSPWDISGAEWLITTYNGARFQSSGSYHIARVTVQVWDSTPDAIEIDDSEWDKKSTHSLTLSSGIIQLATVLGDPSEEIDLGARQQVWWLHASVRGGHEVRAAIQASDELPVGVERYLLQFWSANPE
jgi:hypothetical protein